MGGLVGGARPFPSVLQSLAMASAVELVCEEVEPGVRRRVARLLTSFLLDLDFFFSEISIARLLSGGMPSGLGVWVALAARIACIPLPPVAHTFF